MGYADPPEPKCRFRAVPPVAGGRERELRLHLREPVVERAAGAAHGADRILLAAWIEQFAQAADMHVHGALIDIDIAASDGKPARGFGRSPLSAAERPNLHRFSSHALASA